MLLLGCKSTEQHNSTAMLSLSNANKASENFPPMPSFDEVALISAAEVGQVKTVHDQIKHGVSVNTRNKFAESALSVAARSGHTNVVNLLLSSGADPNAADRDGVDDTMNFVLKLGDNGNLTLKDGYTPLMHAAQSNHPKVVHTLLAKGADPNRVSFYTRTTALIIAAPHDSGAILKQLIARGADLNAKNYDGRTALMNAAEVGNPRSTKVLLDAGTDATIQDNTGKTVFDLVRAPSEGEMRTPAGMERWETLELIRRARQKVSH